MELDDLYFEIQHLYVVQKMSQKELLNHLADVFELHVKQQQLKNKLRQWKLKRNLSRSQAIALAVAATDGSTAMQTANFCDLNPVPVSKLEKYLRRNKIVCTTRPRSVPGSVPSSNRWTIPERILHSNIAALTAAFQAKEWHYQGIDALIRSSENQREEKVKIHSFINHIDMGISAASQGQIGIARQRWNAAFEDLEFLILGRYHDNLPNIIQKINDLNVKGHPAVASQLQRHLARYVINHDIQSPHAPVYRMLALVHLEDMQDMENRLMAGYVDMFEKYLPKKHYNSHVMKMNSARRELLRNPWATLQDTLPSLKDSDLQFGASDRRSLDILRLRSKVSCERGDYMTCESTAKELKDRARSITDDPWQAYHFLIMACYQLAVVQTCQGRHQEGQANITEALDCIQTFRYIERADIFHTEEVVLQSLLRDQHKLQS